MNMQEEIRISELIEYLEQRKNLKLKQEWDSNNDTITFLDTGDLTRIIYSLNWVLNDKNEKFMGLENV